MTTYAAYLDDKLSRPEIAALNALPVMDLHQQLKEKKWWQPDIPAHAAAFFGLPLWTQEQGEIPAYLVEHLELALCKSHLFLPVAETEAHITVALASPEKALPLIDDYRQLVEKPLELVWMPEDKLLALIHAIRDKTTRSADAVADEIAREDENDLQTMAARLNAPDDLLDSEHDAPVIRLINSTLTQALKEGASDIHIEPFEKQVSVRFRVDGMMHTVITPSRKLHAAISARLKVMAGLDIAEKRLPQDGRFKVRLAGRETDVRMSTLPTQHGERVVLRLLGQQEGVRKLDAIGLRPQQLEIMQGFFTQANGILLVSGPTGSGKTSTLYAGLRHINTPDKNIVTVEDPVEYQLEGLGQIQVNSKIGMTFAAGLRSILRQDPDVVVVGETRDLETAQIAVEASLTGHLVLSTIHTNSAAATITRLVEMGIEPFLVASSLRGVVAQRMVRLLHPAFKKPRKLDGDTKKLFMELPAWARPKESEITLYEAVPGEGCPTGYSGRSGIFEIMVVNDTIRHLIHNRACDTDIEKAAQKDKMLTLYQEGLLMAARGETTLEEVMRVTRTQV